MEEKLCPRCHLLLSIDRFNKSVSHNGYQSHCKTCHAEYMREYRMRVQHTATAREKATTELIRRHPDEYSKLMDHYRKEATT